MLARADVHVHPLLGKLLIGRDPARKHRPPPFYMPLLSYVDYPRAHAAGIRLLCSVIYVPPAPWWSPMREVERLIQYTADTAGDAGIPVRVVRTGQEMREAARSETLALVHVVEGGHVIGNDESEIDRLADMGVRYITLVHFVHNRIGGAAAVPFGGNRGLKEFGRRVVRRMYARGILADVSHATVPTFWDVMDEATGPVLATHSGARFYALRDRNLDADQAKAIAKTGGVIGVIMCPFYLKAWRFRATVSDVVDNIMYFVNLVGPAHVTIGSDLDGWIWPVQPVRDISDEELIAEALLGAGLSESDVSLIMGESLVRMFERVDAARAINNEE